MTCLHQNTRQHFLNTVYASAHLAHAYIFITLTTLQLFNKNPRLLTIFLLQCYFTSTTNSCQHFKDRNDLSSAFQSKT